jgi:hypothetical protein
VQFNNFNEGWGQTNEVAYNASSDGGVGWQTFTKQMYDLTKSLLGDTMLLADATGGAHRARSIVALYHRSSTSYQIR